MVLFLFSFNLHVIATPSEREKGGQAPLLPAFDKASREEKGAVVGKGWERSWEEKASGELWPSAFIVLVCFLVLVSATLTSLGLQQAEHKHTQDLLSR